LGAVHLVVFLHCRCDCDYVFRRDPPELAVARFWQHLQDAAENDDDKVSI
jgi:hypothetical protein